MQRHADERGFGIVEVIIAMFLLAIVAVAILPALWQGIAQTATQSSTATATRYLNSLVEDAREAHSCTALTSIATPPSSATPMEDGRGGDLTVSGTVTNCSSGSTARLTLNVSGGGKVLASTTALIFIP
ncbi:type II secretion system protein [Microbacterium sp. BK668]|uniref:prepilin-type N-terminal cleavage/methylation domain-containing protein n=1 Tax=Microbacterium sp. BK668 TaxID=2512118 RepID=UPI00105C12A5|nr:type II secretion system protein [Microbacterium sp. BK668]TDN93235.1 prepilin-type N-terminal cleavage/methylation domain-containing protein [Microbacterium sp. BK668]